MESSLENASFGVNNTIFFSPIIFGSYSLTVVTTVSVITSATCLFFIFFKLKALNKFIKICLIIMACQQTINASICLFGNITMKITSRKSMLTCLLVTQPPLVSTRSNLTMYTTHRLLGGKLGSLNLLSSWAKVFGGGLGKHNQRNPNRNVYCDLNNDSVASLLHYSQWSLTNVRTSRYHLNSNIHQ